MLGDILIYLLRRSGPLWVMLSLVLWIVGGNNSWFETTYTDAHIVIDDEDLVKVKYDNDTKTSLHTYPYNNGTKVEQVREHGSYTELNKIPVVVVTILSIIALFMLISFFVQVSIPIDEKDARGKAWLTYYVLKWRGQNPDEPNGRLIIVIMTLDMSYGQIAQCLTKIKK